MKGSMCRTLFLLATITTRTSPRTFAADVDPHAADRKQLLHLMAEVVAGINKQNIDRMLAQMD